MNESLSVSRATGPDDTVRRTPTKSAKRKNRKKRAKATANAKVDPGPEPAPEPEPEPEPEIDPVELAEQEQQAEGSPWQQKIQSMSRPEVEPHPWSGPGRATDPDRRAFTPRFRRRRERALGDFVANHPARIVEKERREQREIDDAPYQADEARAALETKLTAARQRAKSARKRLDQRGLSGNVDVLLEKVQAARKDESWYELDNAVDELNDEVRRLVAFVDTIDSARERIGKLPDSVHKLKFTLMSRVTELGAALRKSATDPTFGDRLQAVVDAIQTEEDKLEKAGERAKLREEGRWPGNNNEDAVIETATRTTVGADDGERAAVAEALDALKDPSTSHGWARKWGAYHGNGEGNLPGVPGAGGYTEYYVRPPGSAVGDNTLQRAGARRLVRHNASGRVYYSHNHYGAPDGSTLPAFVLVTDA